MERSKFIELLEDHLNKTGYSDGLFNHYWTVGDREDVNSTFYVDGENFLWLTGDDSVKRIKTPINMEHVVEFRWDAIGDDNSRFFIICDDYSGLDIVDSGIYYFENGNYGDGKDAIEWFTEHPV